MELPVIDFEGTLVTPKKGVYRCPFKCGPSGYAPPTWKTERGFRKHMETCPKSPSALKKQQEVAEKRQREYEQRKAEALSSVTQQIGDEVFWVQEVIVKGEYENWGARTVRVRYEPVKRFDARKDKIESINAGNWGVYFNHPAWNMTPNVICSSMEEAKAKATEMQRKWDQWCADAAACR